MRIMLFNESQTYNLPDTSRVIPVGSLKVAVSRMPSAEPLTPT